MKRYVSCLALLITAGFAQAKDVCTKSADGYDVCAAARGAQKIAAPELPLLLSPQYKVISVRSAGQTIKVTSVYDQVKNKLPSGTTLASLSQAGEKLTHDYVCKDENLAEFIAHGGIVANTVKLRDGTMVGKVSVTTCN